MQKNSALYARMILPLEMWYVTMHIFTSLRDWFTLLFFQELKTILFIGIYCIWPVCNLDTHKQILLMRTLNEVCLTNEFILQNYPIVLLSFVVSLYANEYLRVLYDSMTIAFHSVEVHKLSCKFRPLAIVVVLWASLHATLCATQKNKGN